MYSMILIFIIFLFLVVKRYKPRVSAVIPAYNEEETVADVVNAVKKSKYVDEIIVVDDGSTDKTYEKALNAGAKVIKHEKNKGKGAALKTGFKESSGDIILFLDADLKNINPKKVDRIVEPIIRGEADITKSKFKRKAGRVTELTAKPLLNFFFPELNFKQPLSGQFAAKRSVLEKVKFEEDYGVDIGIILDADAHGFRIKEVDIGTLNHKMSDLSDLNLMANEVVRTIVNRAVEYGRVAMMDTIGNSIRMCVLGLSLTSFGIFSIFFTRIIPLYVGIALSILGFIVAMYYLVILLMKSCKIILTSKNPISTIKSFIYMHFPVLVSALILFAILSALFGSIHVEKDKISIQPVSGNLVIWKKAHENRTIAIKGPYTIDSALENESNIIRMPADAIDTLGINYGDKIYIYNLSYEVREPLPGENNVIRMPQEIRSVLNVNIGDVIQDNNLRKIFKNVYVLRNIYTSEGLTVKEGVLIQTQSNESKSVNIYFDNKFLVSTSGIMKEGYYSVYVNGIKVDTIYFDGNAPANYTIYWNGHIINIYIKENGQSDMMFANSLRGRFLDFNITNSSSL